MADEAADPEVFPARRPRPGRERRRSGPAQVVAFQSLAVAHLSEACQMGDLTN
jgi:hypothetical protein